MGDGLQRLSADVGRHVLRADEGEGDGLVRHVLPDEVVADVDVLCPGMVVGVVGQRDAALAVRSQDGRPGRVVAEPAEERAPQMASFTAAVVAMYSVSTVDSATVFCLALCQLMAPPAA